MTEHPSVELTRQGYEAFAKGDMATLSELMADDITWHVEGAGSLSGTYRGREDVFGFFGRLAEETGGTFSLDVHDVLANDEHVVALCTLSASRGVSRSRSRWPTSATCATPRSPSSGRRPPTRRQPSTS